MWPTVGPSLILTNHESGLLTFLHCCLELFHTTYSLSSNFPTCSATWGPHCSSITATSFGSMTRKNTRRLEIARMFVETSTGLWQVIITLMGEPSLADRIIQSKFSDVLFESRPTNLASSTKRQILSPGLSSIHSATTAQTESKLSAMSWPRPGCTMISYLSSNNS